MAKFGYKAHKHCICRYHFEDLCGIDLWLTIWF